MNPKAPTTANRARGQHADTLLKAARVLAVFFVLVSAAAFWLYFGSPVAHVAGGKQVEVRIPPGSSTRAIASLLAKSGVVGSANGFALLARLTGADGKLKPGVYDLTTGMSTGSTIAALTAGSQIDYVTVTIPEGFRADQIADRLQKEADISRAEFLRLAEHGASVFADRHPYLSAAYNGSLEGYLFPKTYEVRRNAPAEQVIGTMLDQFDRETAGLDYAFARQHGLSPAQVVTIASMVERESKLDRERVLVSSVIYNRLRRGMRLKIDATIEYVLRNRRLRLTNRDLYTATPYNTYLHGGVPPGPISNPGLKSLEAAAHPGSTAFLYYVLTGKDGSHTFTTNLADFLVAKRKSKEVFGQ